MGPVEQMGPMGGVLISAHDPRDAVMDHIIHDFKVSLDHNAIDLAPYILEPVDDQGNTSICVSESGTAVKSWQDQVNDFNPLFLYNGRDNPDSDSGMSVKNVCHLLFTLGHARHSVYSTNNLYISNYAASNPRERFESSVLVHAAQHKILGYGKVHSLEVVLQLLKLSHIHTVARLSHSATDAGYNIGPLLVVLPVFENSGESFWRRSHYGQNLVGYHCVTIVGYNPSTSMLKLRNSWGTSYQDNGYFYMSYNDWQTYAVETWFTTNDLRLSSMIQDQVALKTSFHSTGDGEEYEEDGLPPSYFSFGQSSNSNNNSDNNASTTAGISVSDASFDFNTFIISIVQPIIDVVTNLGVTCSLTQT